MGPDFKKPEVAVPANWRARVDLLAVTWLRSAPAVWWRAFNDPTLDHLVELANSQNLPLQIAGLRTVQLAPRALPPSPPASSSTQPTAGATRLACTTVADVTHLDRNLLYYQAGFDVAWELDFWGKYRRGVESEAANLVASVADYYSAIVSLTAEVARTYVVIRTFEVLIEQAQENAKIQKDGPDIVIAASTTATSSRCHSRPRPCSRARSSIPQLEIACSKRNALATPRHRASTVADWTEQEIPKAQHEGGRGCSGRDAATAPGYPQRRASAWNSNALRIGVAKAGPLSELFPGRHGRTQATIRSRTRTTTYFSHSPVSLRRRPADQLDVSQLRSHEERHPRRGRPLSATVVELLRHSAQGRPEGGGRLSGFSNSQESIEFMQRRGRAQRLRDPVR